MPFRHSIEHKYFMNAMSVMYVEDCNILCIQDEDDNGLEVHGVDADTMMRLARNMFCACDKVHNYTKDKDVTLEFAKEIVNTLSAYIDQEINNAK